ncbi:hypothetical protein [Stenotrophomonas sp.]|uniref:hypothetical protein n=1 Tax=Stenotrophomonas sp. TaxID=69392 RepID=UPI00289C1F98|nr:hypothetical protein [Stenotrophomonas sp.]
MPHLTVSARAHVAVEARPQNNSVVLKIGDVTLSLDKGEAQRIGKDLLALVADGAESISGPVIATADHSNDAVVISVGGRDLLHLDPAAWTSLCMQGSSAALELRRKGLRVGLRSPQLLLGNADLVQVVA